MAFSQAKSFLASQTLQVILQEPKQDLAYLKTSDTVGTAFLSLAERHVLSEPIIDGEGEYYGCLSVNDLLKGLLQTLEASHGKGWVENVSTLEAQDLIAAGAKLCKKRVDGLGHAGELWLMEALSESSLLDALLESFNIKDVRVHHRIFVCSSAHQQPAKTKDHITVITIAPGLERSDSTALKVTGVVSQTDIVRLLWKNKQVLGEALDQTVEVLGLDGGAVFTIPCTTPAIVAFAHMGRDHKSCLGITDPATGKLIGNISVSDLRGLAPADFPLLLLSVAEFDLVQQKKVSQVDALAGKRLENPAASLQEHLPLLSVAPTSTLAEVFEKLVSTGMHRVHVVDPQGMPRSIITLTDLLRLVTSTPTRVESTGPIPMIEDDEDGDDEDEDDEDEDDN